MGLFMKICVIGAGISGLSVAKLLNDYFDIDILELKQEAGGIARTKVVNNVAYHINGGHIFNSIYDDVLDFVFNSVLSKKHWNFIERKAKVFFKDHWIDYPIEFSIKQISQIDFDLAYNITKEMFNCSYKNGRNLQDWLINHFGETLAKEYFIPYNKKIWGVDPIDMDNIWIKDNNQMKLPIPDNVSFFRSLISSVSDKMSHRNFFYPKTNNQNTFIEALRNGLNITFNYKVDSIEKINSKWLVNGERVYDIVINTSPLNELSNILKNIPDTIKTIFSLLRYNKISNIFWSTYEDVDMTWGYIPSQNIGIHRISNIGNILRPKVNFCTTEMMGDIPYETLVKEGRKIPFLKDPLDYNITERSYVFFDLNYSKAKKDIMSYLSEINFITHGRFGEWEYYNMDVCIKKSIDLAKKLKKLYGSERKSM